MQFCLKGGPSAIRARPLWTIFTSSRNFFIFLFCQFLDEEKLFGRSSLQLQQLQLNKPRGLQSQSQSHSTTQWQVTHLILNDFVVHSVISNFLRLSEGFIIIIAVSACKLKRIFCLARSLSHFPQRILLHLRRYHISHTSLFSLCSSSVRDRI